jgi:hypothetical protein
VINEIRTLYVSMALEVMSFSLGSQTYQSPVGRPGFPDPCGECVTCRSSVQLDGVSSILVVIVTLLSIMSCSYAVQEPMFV